MTRLSVAIQHHPARPDLPKRLRGMLNAHRNPRGTLIEVVTDPDPTGDRNPWRTARECWARTPEACTHRLVLQDDALPCPRFLHHATLALTAQPDRITSFFLSIYPVQTYRDALVASQRCAAWVQGSHATWVPAVALAVPRAYCESLAAFNDGSDPIADDEVYGRWTRHHGLPWWCTIPSLVDHDDDAPSLMRDPYARGVRRAACFIGGTDPALIQWDKD